MNSAKLLLVSNRKEIKDLCKDILAEYHLLSAADLGSAVNIVLKEELRLVLIDWPSDLGDKQEALQRLIKYNQQAPLIILDDLALAPELLLDISRNKFKFWPLNASPAQTAEFLTECIAKKNMQQENRKLLDRLAVRYTSGDFLGRGNYYNLVISKIEECCRVKEPVLIVGERGTEKEIIAYEIYRNSSFSNGCFVKRCLANGALDDISFIYEAANGCLVLEDVSLLGPEDQQKLKALLNEQLVSLRYILFSSISLDEKVKKGEFDAELYQKIALYEIDLLPLRERIKDLPDIIDSYLQLINEINNFTVSGVSDETLLALSRYPWPGNTAELRAVLALSCYRQRQGELRPTSLPLVFNQPESDELTIRFQEYFDKTLKKDS